MGIGVSAAEAFNATPPVLPDPSTSSETPARGWLYSASMTIFKDTLVATGHRMNFPELVFDIGAMRKVDKGICYLTMQNISAFGTTFTVNMVGRVAALCMT